MDIGRILGAVCSARTIIEIDRFLEHISGCTYIRKKNHGGVYGISRRICERMLSFNLLGIFSAVHGKIQECILFYIIKVLDNNPETFLRAIDLSQFQVTILERNARKKFFKNLQRNYQSYGYERKFFKPLEKPLKQLQKKFGSVLRDFYVFFQ